MLHSCFSVSCLASRCYRPDFDRSILIGSFTVQQSGATHSNAVNHIQEVGFILQHLGDIVRSLLRDL